MAVINGADYRDISVAYANARDDIIGAKQGFFDAVYIVVLLQVIKPEVDLLIDFWESYLINTDTLESPTLFLAAVRSINQHVLIEGNFSNVDEYLVSEGITVPQTWADLSNEAGFAISQSNVDPA